MNKYRIATGYDLHKISKSEENCIKCGGHDIICDYKIDGAHSDGDAVFHALTDALLTVKHTDIGILFPNNMPINRNRESKYFLLSAYRLIKDEYLINNIDIIVISDELKIAPHNLSIRKNISQLLDLLIDEISIKGKTTENTKLNTIEVYATVLLKKK